jgi:enoyl-CoA hydratase/carnithine racemase
MNVFIVHAHPEAKSFNSAMSQRVADTLRADGHDLRVSDTGRTLTGTEAFEYGLVTMVTAADDLDRVVDDLCHQIMQNSPNSIGAYKTLYREQSSAGRTAALEIEASSRFGCPDAPDRVAGFLATLKAR